MSKSSIELNKEYQAARNQAKAVVADYDDNDKVSQEDLSEVKRLIDKAEGLKAEYQKAKRAEEKAANGEDPGDDGQDVVLTRLKGLDHELGMIRTASGEKRSESGLVIPEADSMGDAFINSDEYLTLQKRLAPMASNPARLKQARVQTEGVTIGRKALLTGASSTSAGAFITTDRQNIFERLGRKPLSIRDVVSKGSTDSDTVDYIRETSNTNAADFVPEATTNALPTVTVDGNAQSGVALVNHAGGGYKPEGTFALEVVETTVKTMAEWMAATKRSLADAGQVRTLINSKLQEDLREKEDDALLNGSGSGENIRGILQTSGIQTHAAAATIMTGDAAGMAVVEYVSRAKTKVRIVGRSRANAVVMNPYDLENALLQRVARNTLDDGVSFGVPTIAGLPVVESENIAQGTALVGDFSKAIIWDREGITITATDTHADYFIRNMVAVLAEYRFAFGVTRPTAFCTVDLTP